MGRAKLKESDKKERVQVFLEKKKIDLLSYENCVSIANTAINKEYDKKLKSKE